jgi:hypothetical protein
MSAGALAALPLLALNDVWGANAEPYRFWIEGILLGGVLSVFALCRLAGIVLVPGRAEKPSATEPRWLKRGFVASLLIIALLWTASLPDWVNSLKDPAMQAVWNPSTPREQAIETLAREATLRPGEGLLTTELCIDNRTVKVLSGSPVANYHLGMAWPADRAAIDDIVKARDAEELDPPAMRESNTRWVLTDSNCDSDWATRYAGDLRRVESLDYELADGESISRGSQGPGTITLWELSPGA